MKFNCQVWCNVCWVLERHAHCFCHHQLPSFSVATPTPRFTFLWPYPASLIWCWHFPPSFIVLCCCPFCGNILLPSLSVVTLFHPPLLLALSLQFTSIVSFVKWYFSVAPSFPTIDPIHTVKAWNQASFSLIESHTEGDGTMMLRHRNVK